MTFSERVLALTQDYLLPKVVDNVLNSNILALRLIGNAKQGKGESIKKAIKYQNSGTATSFAGLDTFSAAQLDTKVRMSFDMRAVRQPVAISGMEATANAVSETQVTDLVKEALEESQMELIDYIGTMLYGTGTGNGNKDLIGIGAIVDDGTDVSTIGGLSRSTYSVLNATRTASGGTLTLNKLATLYSAISSGAGQTTPTLIISNETVWDLYESLLTPIVRENYSMMGYYQVGINGGATRSKEGLHGTQGFVALSYKGVPWVRDEKATAQNVFMLNENWMDFYGWDAPASTGYKKISLGQGTVEGVYAESPMSQFSGFNWSGFQTPTNQFGTIADLILMGNLTSWQPRRHGRLTGVTGV
jgi:hypothetical protein